MRKQATSRLSLLLLLLAPVAVSPPCRAQTRSTPTTKVAVIDTRAFEHATTGIESLVRVHRLVDNEFAATRAELSLMYARLGEFEQRAAGWSGTIPTDPQPITPERKKELMKRFAEMRRQFDRHQNEVRKAYEARVKEVVAPVNEDIRRSLAAFARERGITMLLDASALNCPVGCDVKAATDIDVTQEFIREYNRRHRR